jgi:transposase
MAYAISLSDEQWDLVRDLFETDRGRPPVTPRRQMVDAMVFLCRTGCQWRYLPERFGPWGAVWAQWLRWRESGVWATAMDRLARRIRAAHGRKPTPSMVMIDAQTVKGGRAGPTFREAGGRGGRTIGAKRTVLIEIMGLPVGAHVESAKAHDVSAGRRLIHSALPALAIVTDVLADRGYRGLTKAAGMHHARVQIKAPAPGQSGFKPIAPLYKVEHAFAQLGRWRRLSRCFEGTQTSAEAWLRIAAFGYLLGRV